ncbi:hypothetical protein RQP46_008649 [Phenoliferia psychrophenolica]
MRADYNNTWLVQSITTAASSSTPTKRKPRREPLPSAPLLLLRLPTLSALEAEGARSAKRAKSDHILSESLATAIESPLDAFAPAPTPKPGAEGGAGHGGATKAERRASSTGANADGSYEAFQVLRAIEKHDIMLLMDVKTRNFELLTQAVGGTTPLVNDVSDNEMDRLEPSTRSTLRAIRANLKVAIQYGLASSQTDLIASFLQVTVMSEGDKFIHTATNKVAHALRAGPAGAPVASASTILAKWVSRELKEQEVASVSEYIANATADLVLLGLWHVATDAVKGEAIPTWYFARDDRITKALDERLDELKRAGSYKKLSGLLRKQLEVSIEINLRRNVGGREKVEMLKKALDEG